MCPVDRRLPNDELTIVHVCGGITAYDQRASFLYSINLEFYSPVEKRRLARKRPQS
jgi:hypothetical protein